MEKMEEREERLQHLESENALLRTELKKMENRMDELESTGRRNNVLISGSAIPSVVPGESDGQAVVKVLKNLLKYEISPSEITKAYRVGSKSNTQAPDRRSIMVQLLTHDRKNDMLQACRKVKPPNLYINDDLIPIRSKIQYALRQIKKSRTDRIAYCGSWEGRVYIWLKPPNSSAPNQRVFINSIDRYRKLCSDELKIDPDEYFHNE